jgi:[ribosomal protein S5]-alanine N-acetyltransferase
MKPPRHFETARLRLRPPALEDAPALFEQYTQDAEVTRYMTWKPHTDASETDAYLRRALSDWEDGSAFPWVVTRTQDDQLMGMVEVRIDRYKADLGYVLAKAFWGEGYMTEAVAAVLGWAAEQETIYRVWAVCDVDNLASARVMEKAGMQREGILRRWILHPNISGEPRDCYCYAWAR